MRRTVSGRWVKIVSRCNNRRCPSCGWLWAGDTRVKLLRNIEAYGKAVSLVTVTAPGSEHLPWDEHHCEHRGHHRHSGGIGCRVHSLAAKLWNEQAPADWRRLHRRASQRAKRHARKHGGSWSVIAMQWEFQKRGVLHRHVVVPMGSPLERICSQIYAEALNEGAAAAGFGYVDRGKRARAESVWTRRLEVVPPERAARYLAKYIAAVSGDGKLSLSETVKHPQVPGHVCFVGRGLTTSTGCTMRSLRRHRLAYVLMCRNWTRISSEQAATIVKHFASGPAVPDPTDEEIIAELLPRGPTAGKAVLALS
jgi:hypothetical protein